MATTRSELRAAARGFLLLLPALAAACSDRPAAPFVDGEAALAHARAQVAFGPRPSGSEALRKTGDWIQSELAALGLTPKEDVWEEKGIRFRNIWAEIPGPDERIVILAAHYDTKKFEGHPDPAHNFRFVGANDGASGPGLLLELARRILERPVATAATASRPAPRSGGADAGRRATVWIVFFDGEECLHPTEWQDENSLFGSRRFARRVAKEWFPSGAYQRRISGLILLDMVGAKDLKIDMDGFSSPDAIEIFREAAQQLGHSKYFFANRSEYKDDHIPFKNLGIRVIDVIDLHGRQPDPSGRTPKAPGEWWHTAADDLDILSADSLRIVGETVLRALELWEQRLLK